MDKLALQQKFQKSLNDLYEVYQKSEPKERLPYGEPMNLKPIVSSVEFLDRSSFHEKNAAPKSLEGLLRTYGALKNEFKLAAGEINMLNSLEQMKRDYVKRRDQGSLFAHLTDFEKLNKDKELKAALRKVKQGILDMSGRIDKRMDTLNSRILDLSNLRESYERKYVEMSKRLNAIKIEEATEKHSDVSIKKLNAMKISKYNRQLSDGIKLCEQIIRVARERKDSLNRSMWMETPVIDKPVFEKIGLPALAGSKSVNSKEMT